MTLLAQGLLKTHWDQSVPVNLARIAKAMQVAVALAALPAGSCARIEISLQRQPRIVIDRQQPLERQRYGVAHALGHLALHHLRPGMQHTVRISDNYHIDTEQRMEREANDFALHLLIPEQVLRYSLEQGQACTPEALAHLFAVAPIVVKQRMADLSLHWPRSLAQQLRPEDFW